MCDTWFESLESPGSQDSWTFYFFCVMLFLPSYVQKRNSEDVENRSRLKYAILA